MLNIFTIPLYYIGFKRNHTLEKQLSKVGFTNINHFPAIDGRKMDPQKLLKNNIISIRAYNDLKFGRHQHTGISSMGTIGCTLSHRELWGLCAKKYKYMIIAEDDINVINLSNTDVTNIQNALSKKNGCFISTKINKGREILFGLHFYFLTNGAAKEIYNKSLPIDLQTDSYIGNLGNIGNINIQGYPIFKQKYHISSTSNICIKCWLPTNIVFYVIIVIFIIFIIFLVILFYKKFHTTKIELDSVRSSCINN